MKIDVINDRVKDTRERRLCLNAPYGPVRLGGSLRGILVATAFFVLGGCTLFEPVPAEQQVWDRAQRFADALRTSDWEAAYAYTTPGFRATSTQVELASRFLGAAEWKDVSVTEVSCTQTRCEVSLNVSYRMSLLGITNTRPLEQVWINVDDSWFFYS